MDSYEVGDLVASKHSFLITMVSGEYIKENEIGVVVTSLNSYCKVLFRGSVFMEYHPNNLKLVKKARDIAFEKKLNDILGE